MKNLYLLVVVLFVLSCSKVGEYALENSWNKDKSLCFEYTNQDTSSYRKLTIHVTNNDQYRTSNLYLFLEIVDPDGQSYKDTLNYWLADKKGEWLGTSFLLDSWESDLDYVNLLKMSKLDDYKIYIKHGMRYNDLVGIDNIGVSIQKIER